MKILIAVLFLVSLSPAHSKIELECHNDIVLESPLRLKKAESGEWIFMEACPGEFLEFEGQGNYEGWEKLAPQDHHPSCLSLGESLFSVPRKIDWVLLSPKVLKGESAFIQISYENLSEYGTKSIKTFLKCLD